MNCKLIFERSPQSIDFWLLQNGSMVEIKKNCVIAPDSKALLLAGITFFDPPCFLLCVLRKFVFAAKRAWASTSTDGGQIERSFPSSAWRGKDKDKQQHHRIIKVQFHLLPSVYFLQSQAIAAIPPSLPRLDWLLRSRLVADCGWVHS